MTTVVAARRSTYEVGILPLPPSEITVTVWWYTTPIVQRPSNLWWSATPPQVCPVRFKIIFARLGRGDTRRARVDLAYPIDETPGGLGEKDLFRLRNTLAEAIQKALPEWDVAVWRQERIDPVCRRGE